MTVRSLIIVLSIWLQLYGPGLAWAGGCGDAFTQTPLVVQVIEPLGQDRELVVGESLSEQLESLANLSVDTDLMLDLDGPTMVSLLSYWRFQDTVVGREIQKRLSAMESKAIWNLHGVKELSVISETPSTSAVETVVNGRNASQSETPVARVLRVVERYFPKLQGEVQQALETLRIMNPEEVFALALAGEGPLLALWMASPVVQDFIFTNGLFEAEHVLRIFRALAYGYAGETLASDNQNKTVASMMSYGSLDSATDPVNVPLRLKHLEETATNYRFASGPIETITNSEDLSDEVQLALGESYLETAYARVIKVIHQVPYFGSNPDVNEINLLVYRIRWTQVTIMPPASLGYPSRSHRLHFFEFLGFDERHTSPGYRFDALSEGGYFDPNGAQP